MADKDAALRQIRRARSQLTKMASEMEDLLTDDTVDSEVLQHYIDSWQEIELDLRAKQEVLMRSQSIFVLKYGLCVK